MKKIFLLMCVSFLVMSSRGQLLYEPFNYTPHATSGLSAQSGVNWLTVNTGDSILVTSGNLSYPGLAASAGNKVSFAGAGTDYYRLFTAQTAGTVYFSFILNTTSLGSLDGTGGYFIGLVQTGSTTAFGATVWTRLSTTPGKYNIGISTRSNSAVVWLPNQLDPATNYFVVAAYQIIAGTANDVSKIWLNTSAIGGSEPAADATSVAGTDLTTAGVERIFLRQDSDLETAPVDIDEIRVGIAWADVTPGGAPVPALSISSPLTAFGNVCINTTAGPNSFTISGSNLTTADVNVAALAGYTYSTTSGGTYTSTLAIPQTGGTFSQQVFVRFNPVAVQSYNGNIVVSGGGASSSVNAAAAGSGINSAPSVTTGAASAITTTTATLAGNITATGCTPVTVYGIEYSTTNGFANGSGTQVASTNLAGGSFSADLSLLSPATTYYYKAYATNGAGTVWGAQQSFTTANLSPSINTTALTSFGNVCVNTTAGPNSFTITGSNLTTEDVAVAALPGYTYSATAGGTYTATLSFIQPGGTFSQQVFVRFDPTAIQSYNGNIAITGGGISAAVNVAATGSGVNSAPTITTGAASSVTTVAATTAGTITATGCTGVTAYGIEYSTTNGFANGSGTQVASTNLSGGNYTSGLSGLTPGTVYYYKAYATNGGGTAYGAQQSFTTASPSLAATTLTAFGGVCVNATAGPNSFTLSSTNLTNANVVVGALNGYTYSTTAGGTYTATLTITQPGGNFSQQVFVKLTPVAVQSYNGNIPVTGGGTPGTLNVAASGNGVNTPATVTTVTASEITATSAVASGNIGTAGCSSTTASGVEYSTIRTFGAGSGIQVASTTSAGTGFSSLLTGLVPGSKYYYRAYATNSGGTSYGALDSFTVHTIAGELTLSPVPVKSGDMLKVSIGNLAPGYYGVLIFDSNGRLVLQENMNTQSSFINRSVYIPAGLATGVYRVELVNNFRVLTGKSILITAY
ncbi:MAG: fibronectin type III domain-containing protein [Chitinophagaceae bacterium]|nr:fibronectin type III domain-containing protein [Chitinophagaceae bacterium]